MSSGPNPDLVRALLLLIALAIPAGHASESELLPSLFSAIAAHPQNDVRYEETKHVYYLEAPLKSEGSLHYQPPDTIVRQQDFPDAATFSISDSELAVQKGSRKRVLNIDKAPLMQVFRQAICGILDGDLPVVAEFAELSVAGSLAKWELQLKPKAQAHVKAVRNIVFRGREGIIEEIEINEPNGDWSLMKLKPQSPLGDGK